MCPAQAGTPRPKPDTLASGDFGDPGACRRTSAEWRSRKRQYDKNMEDKKITEASGCAPRVYHVFVVHVFVNSAICEFAATRRPIRGGKKRSPILEVELPRVAAGSRPGQTSPAPRKRVQELQTIDTQRVESIMRVWLGGDGLPRRPTHRQAVVRGDAVSDHHWFRENASNREITRDVARQCDCGAIRWSDGGDQCLLGWRGRGRDPLAVHREDLRDAFRYRGRFE